MLFLNLGGVPVQSLLITDPHAVGADDPEDLDNLPTAFSQELPLRIHPVQLIGSFGVQSLEILSRVVKLENLGLGLLTNVGVVNGLELTVTQATTEEQYLG